MATITVVGIGPGPLKYLTKEAESELLHAGKIFFRTAAHPVYGWLKDLDKHLVSFDALYTMPWKKPAERYAFMVAALFKEAALRDHAVYAVPGSATLLEDTTKLIKEGARQEGVDVRVIAGVSFLDPALDEINHDFLGLQVVLPLTHIKTGRFTEKLGLMVCQIEAAPDPKGPPRVDLTMNLLLQTYPADHPVTLIWTDGLPEYTTKSKTVALKDLASAYGTARFFASLYVPPIE